MKYISSFLLTASKQRYVPPNQRGPQGPVGMVQSVTKFLSERENPTKDEGNNRDFDFQ